MSASRDLTDGLQEPVAMIQWLVGAWHEFGYEVAPGPGEYKLIPPLGERSAEAVRGGHRAVEEIDTLIGELHKVRQQLVGELRQNQDMVMARLDAKYGPVSSSNA